MTVSMITGKGTNRRKWVLVEEKINHVPLPPPPENDFLKEGDEVCNKSRNQKGE